MHYHAFMNHRDIVNDDMYDIYAYLSSTLTNLNEPMPKCKKSSPKVHSKKELNIVEPVFEGNDFTTQRTEYQPRTMDSLGNRSNN